MPEGAKIDRIEDLKPGDVLVLPSADAPKVHESIPCLPVDHEMILFKNSDGYLLIPCCCDDWDDGVSLAFLDTCGLLEFFTLKRRAGGENCPMGGSTEATPKVERSKPEKQHDLIQEEVRKRSDGEWAANPEQVMQDVLRDARERWRAEPPLLVSDGPSREELARRWPQKPGDVFYRDPSPKFWAMTDAGRVELPEASQSDWDGTDGLGSDGELYT